MTWQVRGTQTSYVSADGRMFASRAEVAHHLGLCGFELMEVHEAADVLTWVQCTLQAMGQARTPTHAHRPEWSGTGV
jgi:hypothetical protein